MVELNTIYGESFRSFNESEEEYPLEMLLTGHKFSNFQNFKIFAMFLSKIPWELLSKLSWKLMCKQLNKPYQFPAKTMGEH